MKILIQENGQSGVFYHRQLIPHIAMVEFDKAVEVIRTDDLLKFPDSVISTIDIFVLHGRIKTDAISRIRKAGKKFVYDVDDYFYTTPDRIFSNEWKLTSHAFVIEGLIRDADLVTTTSLILAQYIKKHTGVKAHILPNAINGNDPQFTPIETESKRLRFGFIGGSSHIVDIPIIAKAVVRLYNEYPEYREHWQIVFGGFDLSYEAYDTRGVKQSIPTKDLPSAQIEKMLTGNYRICSHENRDILCKYTTDETPHDDQYRRIWNRDVYHYAELYNEIDILLAPLADNAFNRCKSNLKIIEAGWMGKEVIASDIGTFKDGLTEDAIMMCDSTEEWMGAMLSDIENFIATGQPIRSNLQDLVRENYNAKNFAEKRYELYKKLI